MIDQNFRGFLLLWANRLGLRGFFHSEPLAHSPCTVKNGFWETNDYPNPAGFGSIHSWMQISLLGWIKIHPQPDSYPVLAGSCFWFLTDNTIIKSRESYIVGHFFLILPGPDFYSTHNGYIFTKKYPYCSGLLGAIHGGRIWELSV